MAALLARFAFRHTGRANFVVWLMDGSGQKQELIANEIGAVSGSKAVGVARSGSYLLGVDADGPWTVTVTQ